MRCIQCTPGAVHIGNPKGKIAVWCDETQANDLISLYGPNDGFTQDLRGAIEEAYPED